MTNAVTSFAKLAKIPGSAYELAFEGHEIALNAFLQVAADENDRPELAQTDGFEIRINGVLVTDVAKAKVADRDLVTLVGKVSNG